MIPDDRLTAEEAAAAAATQTDDTECICLHPRSDHGDGIMHTACCGLIKVPTPHGDHDTTCECKEFREAGQPELQWPAPGHGPEWYVQQAASALGDLKVELWSPSDDPEQNTAAVITNPAKWDGRPFPGRCQHRDGDDQCDNQATVGHGHWDGGAPGQGNWQHWARCTEHVGTEG